MDKPDIDKMKSNGSDCPELMELLTSIGQPEDFAISLLQASSFLSSYDNTSGIGDENPTDSDTNLQQKQLQLEQLLIGTIKHLFSRIENYGKTYSNNVIDTKNDTSTNIPLPLVLSGLDSLYTGMYDCTSNTIKNKNDTNHDNSHNRIFDVENIWGQIDLQNESLLHLLKKSVKKLSKAASVMSATEKHEENGSTNIRTKTSEINQKYLIRLLEDDDQTQEENDNDDDEIFSEDNEEDKLDHLEDDDDENEEAKRIRSRMERVMADMDEADEEDSTDEIGNKDEEEVGIKNVEKKKTDNSDEVIDPAAEELNDGFFNIHEMEAFADEEEEYLPDEAYGQITPDDDSSRKATKAKDTRTFRQKQRDRIYGDDDDDEDENDSVGEDDDEAEESNLLFQNKTTIRRRKYREDDEIEALYGLYSTSSKMGIDEDQYDDDESMDEVINMTAADIFGPPNKKELEQWKQKKKTNKGTSNSHGNKDSWLDKGFDSTGFDDDEGEDDDESGWNDEHKSSKKVLRNNYQNNDDEIDDDDDDEIDDDDDNDDLDMDLPMKGTDRTATNDNKSNKKPPTKQIEKILKQTEEFEKQMLAEKPWQMLGEAGSSARPVNSLLDATPEIEIATKMAPIITVEHTESLEEIIKKRILAEDWDDVIPRELPDVGWHKKKGELPEVSQEKSKLGLGELYEREYLKKVIGYDKDTAEKETEEDKTKSAIRTMFANLCSKLDALSNYRFAPRPIADEAEIRPVTQPAIAMEEVLPLHVSDARAVAPEEVYGSKRGRDGILRTDTELDQNDRKRLRRSKKVARNKARKEKIADEKLISRLQPGIGLNNPYEKRKVREELSMARAGGKIVAGTLDVHGTDYSGSSGTFFKRLQAQKSADESSNNNGAKKDGDGELRNERKGLKSSTLKL